MEFETTVRSQHVETRQNATCFVGLGVLWKWELAALFQIYSPQALSIESLRTLLDNSPEHLHYEFPSYSTPCLPCRGLSSGVKLLLPVHQPHPSDPGRM
jgi:hypothetical protein